MTDKITLQNVSSIDNSLINAINNNNAILTTAMDNTLSRNGQTPNQMSAQLDMNSNAIINIPFATTPNQPVAFGQLTNNASPIQQLTGDVTGVISLPSGIVNTTLATVNSNVGTFGSSTQIPTVTVNGKGLVTAASSSALTASHLSPNGTNFLTTSYTLTSTDYLRILNNFNCTTPITITVPNSFSDGFIFFVASANSSNSITLSVPIGNFIVYDGTAASNTLTLPINNNNNVMCIVESNNLILIGVRNTFSSSVGGIVPASGGGTTSFLRADGTWPSNATTTQYLNDTSTLLLQTDQVWGAAPFTTTTYSATVTLDFSTFINTQMTFGAGNVTFANPSNVKAGQAGTIKLTQDGTGSRTASWGANFHFAGGAAPTLSTAANAVDLLGYMALTTGSIVVFMLVKGIA